MDNDGVTERYEVSVWQTTNYYTVDCLSFRAEENELEESVRQLAGTEELGTPKGLWVDESEYGNVVFMLYEEGLYDFHICGYLLSGAAGRKLLQVDCLVQTEVTFEPVDRGGRE